MTRPKAVGGLFVLVLCWAIGMYSAVSAGDSFQLNKEWLAKDLALVKATKTMISQPFPPSTKFLEHFKSYDKRLDRSLGFGLRQVKFACYGGYTSVWISVVSEGGKIVGLECVQSGSGESWKHIGKQLRSAWKEPVVEDGCTLGVAQYMDRPALDSLMTRSLGAAPEIQAPGDLESSFNLLMSPVKELRVGDRCYYEGRPPDGRVAIDQLTKNARYDLIRAILRGPSPEGRTYAALALIKDHKETAEDRAVVAKLKLLPVPIAVCHGCLVSDEKFSSIISK